MLSGKKNTKLSKLIIFYEIVWIKRKIDALIAQLTFIMLITSHPHKSRLGKGSPNRKVLHLHLRVHLHIKTLKNNFYPIRDEFLH